MNHRETEEQRETEDTGSAGVAKRRAPAELNAHAKPRESPGARVRVQCRPGSSAGIAGRPVEPLETSPFLCFSVVIPFSP